MLDVEASLRALRENPRSGVDPNMIVLFGRSLGGAVALGAAERYSHLVRGHEGMIFCNRGADSRTSRGRGGGLIPWKLGFQFCIVFCIEKSRLWSLARMILLAVELVSSLNLSPAKTLSSLYTSMKEV